MHALSGLVKAISALQQCSKNVESTETTQSVQNAASNDDETAIRSHFPSTNGTVATVQNATSESKGSNQTSVNSVDRQFVGLRARAVARTLIGGVYIHIFMFCPTDFFSN